jgi:hypothetical protein
LRSYMVVAGFGGVNPCALTKSEAGAAQANG